MEHSRNPINRVAQLMPNMLSTGDDEGVIKVRIIR
jgi:hypothetical protein